MFTISFAELYGRRYTAMQLSLTTKAFYEIHTFARATAVENYSGWESAGSLIFGTVYEMSSIK